MDKIDGSRFNFQKVQTDWFEFKKLQTQEQLKINSTVQPKTETFKSDLQKSDQQQASFQNSSNPHQEVANDSSALQRLLEFSTMNSATVPVHTDLDLDAIVASMKNQFHTQTFSGKEFETLLSLLKQHPDNALMKNAISDVLRAFSAVQTINATQNTMEKAIDDLIVLLKNHGTFQLMIKKQENLDNNARKPLSELVSNSLSLNNQQKKYNTYSQATKDLLHQIQNSVPEESSIYKTIDSIFNAMKRLDDAERFDLNATVEKLLKLPVTSKSETTEKLANLIQKAFGTGNVEENFGKKNDTENIRSTYLAQELFGKAQVPPEKNELENAISVINQLKEQYPQSNVVQTLSSQTLNGLTANLLMNQPMLHFLLKSFLNETPYVADVWIDQEYEDGSEKVVKVMLSIDLESSDRFEVELKLSGKMLSAKVMCSESYVDDMQGIKKVIREHANGLGFSVPNVSVGVLTEKQSLEEVFGKDFGGRRSFHARV